MNCTEICWVQHGETVSEICGLWNSKKTEHILVKKNMKKWTKPGVGLTKDGQCEY